MKNDILITLSTGEQAHFSEERLRRSLQRSGASKDMIAEIIRAIESELHEGITTKEIYRTAFKMLKRMARHAAARYKLKNAIMELGPSGYPFEQYVGELLKFQGYCVQVGVIVEGNCVSHEVDVVAENDTSHFIVECKFHNRQGYFCDVKVPLYIHSRFKDIERKYKSDDSYFKKEHHGWIITNTLFSEEAIKYGHCVGLKLVGWDYPERGSLKEWVDMSGLHPLTSLTSLTKAEKRKLLDSKIVLCKNISEKPSLLDELGLRPPKKETVLQECRNLCGKQPAEYS